MAFLTCEGFEGLGVTMGPGQTANIQARLAQEYAGKFDGGNGVYLVDDSVGEAFALAWGNVASANTNQLRYVMPDQKANTVIVGFRFKTSSATATGQILEIRALGFTNTHLNLNLVNSVDIQVRRHTTVLATASAAIVKEQWHYVEFSFFVDNTTGAFELWVDDSSVASGSSVDTQDGSGSALVDLINFNGFDSVSSTDFSAIDDIYVLNNVGSVLATRRGQFRRVRLALPNVDGSPSQWTPSSGMDHFALVDDDPVSATDYVSSSTVNDVDKFGLTNLTGVLNIDAVKLTAHVLAGAEGVSAMRLNAHQSASTTNGSDRTVSDSATVVALSEGFDADPNTGVNWTPSGLDSAEFSVEVRT